MNEYSDCATFDPDLDPPPRSQQVLSHTGCVGWIVKCLYCKDLSPGFF
jgi:hypothetical protein